MGLVAVVVVEVEELDKRGKVKKKKATDHESLESKLGQPTLQAGLT